MLCWRLPRTTVVTIPWKWNVSRELRFEIFTHIQLLTCVMDLSMSLQIYFFVSSRYSYTVATVK
jgi:hypothetical protein